MPRQRPPPRRPRRRTPRRTSRPRRRPAPPTVLASAAPSRDLRPARPGRPPPARARLVAASRPRPPPPGPPRPTRSTIDLARDQLDPPESGEPHGEPTGQTGQPRGRGEQEPPRVSPGSAPHQQRRHGQHGDEASGRTGRGELDAHDTPRGLVATYGVRHSASARREPRSRAVGHHPRSRQQP